MVFVLLGPLYDRTLSTIFAVRKVSSAVSLDVPVVIDLKGNCREISKVSKRKLDLRKTNGVC